MSRGREEGRNRAASSYSGLLNQVLDFVIVVVFLLFQRLTESYSRQFSGYPNSSACLSAKEEKIFFSTAFWMRQLKGYKEATPFCSELAIGDSRDILESSISQWSPMCTACPPTRWSGASAGASGSPAATMRRRRRNSSRCIPAKWATLTPGCLGASRKSFWAKTTTPFGQVRSVPVP